MRNIRTDGILYLTKNELVRNYITSKDVIHSWALPSLKIKIDAIPGRLNHISFMVDSISKEEVILGQCSELCGVNHRFMPIVLSLIKYDY